MTKQEVLKELGEVRHPTINHSLIELGLMTDIHVYKDKISVVFAFPFPNIPIADKIINSVDQVAESLGFEFEYKIRLMTKKEKTKFLQLEIREWQG